MPPQPNVTCPLCGERNDCAPARSGSLDTSCWCTEVVVNPAAIARLPASERNKACLCRRCATSGAAGRLAPVVDRNRCEGKADCVRVCPFGVFEIRKLAPEDRAALSVIGKLKAWAHGGKQSYVANPGSCHACRLCLEACPEDALALRHLP